MPRPGFLKRQFDSVAAEIATWPKWMQPHRRKSQAEKLVDYLISVFWDREGIFNVGRDRRLLLAAIRKFYPEDE